jgi:hypothetical protein
MLKNNLCNNKMPLKIVKFKTGFRVCDDKGQCLSKKPLSKKRAVAQELAVRLSTLRKEGRIPARGSGKVKF